MAEEEGGLKCNRTPPPSPSLSSFSSLSPLLRPGLSLSVEPALRVLRWNFVESLEEAGDEALPRDRAQVWFGGSAFFSWSWSWTVSLAVLTQFEGWTGLSFSGCTQTLVGRGQTVQSFTLYHLAWIIFGLIS